MEISNVKIRLNNVEPHDWIICSRCRSKFPVINYIQHRNDPKSKCYRGRSRKREPPPPVKKPDPVVTVIDLTLDDDDDDDNKEEEECGGGSSSNNIIINLDEDDHDIDSNSTATSSTAITNNFTNCSESKDNELYSTTTTTNDNNINKNTSNDPKSTTTITTTTTSVSSFESSSVFTASTTTTTSLIHHQFEENKTSVDPSDNIYEATTTTNHNSIDVPSHNNNQALNENSMDQVEDIDMKDTDDEANGDDDDDDPCDLVTSNDSSTSLEPDLLRCSYCEDYFLVEEHLENHKQIVHPDKLLSTTSTPTTIPMNNDEEENWNIDTACVVGTVNQISIPASSRRSSTCSETESHEMDFEKSASPHSFSTTTSNTVTSKSFQSSSRLLENEGFNTSTAISTKMSEQQQVSYAVFTASPKVPVNVVQPNSHKVMGVNKDSNVNSSKDADWLNSPGKSINNDDDNDEDDDDDDDQFYAGQVNQKMNTQEYLPSTLITEKIFSSGFNDLTVYNNQNININNTKDIREADFNSNSDNDDNNYKSSRNHKTPRRNYQRKKKTKSPTVQNNINDGYIRRNAALNHASYRENVCPYCGVDLSSSSRLEYHITTQHERDVMEGQKKEEKFKRMYKDTHSNSTCNSTSITNSKSKVTKSSPISELEEEVVSISVRNGRKYKKVKCQYCSKVLTAGYGYKYHIKAHQKSLEIEAKGVVPKNGSKTISNPKKNAKKKGCRRRTNTKISQAELKSVKDSNDEDEDDFDDDYSINQPEDLQQHEEDEKTKVDEQNYYNGNSNTEEQDDRITSETKQRTKFSCPHCNFTARNFCAYYFHKATHQSKLRVKVKAVNPRKSVKRSEKKKAKEKQLEAKEEDEHEESSHNCSKTDPQLDLKKLNNDIKDKNNNIQNPYKVTSQTTELLKEPQTNETFKRKVESSSNLETNKRRKLSKQIVEDQNNKSLLQSSRFYCVMCSSDKFETSEELKTHLKANHGSAVVTAVNPMKNKLVEDKTLQLCRELTKVTHTKDVGAGKNPSLDVLNRCPRMVVRMTNKAISSSFILTPKISCDVSELKNGQETGKELFQCEFCPKKFYSNGMFLLHVLHHHSKVSTQKCPDCFKVFISNHHYEAHRISVHTNNSDSTIGTTNTLKYADAPLEQKLPPFPTLKEEQAPKYNRNTVLPPSNLKDSPLTNVKADVIFAKTDRASSLNIPTERGKNSLVKRHQCTFCRFNYPTSDALGEHIITAHKRISVTKPKRLLHPVFSSEKIVT